MVESRENAARAKALYTHNRFMGELGMIYLGKGEGRKALNYTFIIYFYLCFILVLISIYFQLKILYSIFLLVDQNNLKKIIPCIWKLTINLSDFLLNIESIFSNLRWFLLFLTCITHFSCTHYTVQSVSIKKYKYQKSKSSCLKNSQRYFNS